ncbi:pseudouridine-5'-phosphate glycosidase [Maritalea mediterranea]|uniref:Pseudouridine-5'-phosphate glycosidase n=1 Tax=Maritalea mediterranea TaxID=2909667 RepID=A0ABS9E8G0_9HYPH|nr:pseudouridine-5'-phosphate glycosidase [Maritalea mediterranea]MCF4099137.1 pseudouridine-5'-phosphate glycosidase [Maritalea mediterranea]
MNFDLQFGAHVAEALRNDNPIVALETTVVTHGMAYPSNLETALAMENAVKEAGACPATLGIVNGQVTVGLSEEQLKDFATSERGSIAKCSRRDFAPLLGKKQSGSLTVAGTMIVAAAAKIDIFATGGIGGVHRGHPFDVSADLTELGKTPVAVVCAGAKSILDLPLTLEVLETQGVPIIGYQTPNLPAFYTRDSGMALPHSVDNVNEAAATFNAWRDLGADSGLLFTNPVPEADALSNDEMETIIDKAIAEADANGVKGAAVTPFVLGKVVELSGGRSLKANIALLINNAKLAGEIAVAAKG